MIRITSSPDFKFKPIVKCEFCVEYDRLLDQTIGVLDQITHVEGTSKELVEKAILGWPWLIVNFEIQCECDGNGWEFLDD